MTQKRQSQREVSPKRPSRLGRSRAHVLVIAACLCFMYATGIANLKSAPITHYGEWNSLREVGWKPHEPLNSFPEIITLIKKHSSDQGPLHFFLMRIWGEFVGADLLTYRLLSVYFGLFALVFAYRLALITGDHDTALDAAKYPALFWHLLRDDRRRHPFFALAADCPARTEHTRPVRANQRPHIASLFAAGDNRDLHQWTFSHRGCCGGGRHSQIQAT